MTQTTAPNKVYKAVTVGFAHVHINEVSQHFYDHPRIHLSACADIAPIIPEKKPGAIYTREWNREYCCKKFGTQYYDNWKTMLDEEQPDLCIINSENCHHPMIVEECAKRGIGVCIEKPMATSLSDALKIYRSIQTYNSFLMVNWPITWNPGLHTVKRLITEGVIGDIIEVKTRMGHTGPLGPGASHRIDQTAEPMTESEKCSTWWHQNACGGGAMADYCCYGAMVSYWMIEQTAIAAMGMRCNAIHRLGNAEDNAAILVRYPNAYAVLEGTWSTYDHTFKSPIVYGTKGALVGDYKTGKVQLYRPDGTVEDIANDPMPDKLKDVACAYVHHMDTGEPLHCTSQLSYNLWASAILDAGIRSAKTGMQELINNAQWQIG